MARMDISLSNIANVAIVKQLKVEWLQEQKVNLHKNMNGRKISSALNLAAFDVDYW